MQTLASYIKHNYKANKNFKSPLDNFHLHEKCLFPGCIHQGKIEIRYLLNFRPGIRLNDNK